MVERWDTGLGFLHHLDTVVHWGCGVLSLLASKIDAVWGGLGWWVCWVGFKGVKAGRVEPKEKESLVLGIKRVEVATRAEKHMVTKV